MQGEHPAKKIKFLLRTCQMSFQELADRTGVTLEALRDFLDERAVPPPSLLRRIAAALGAKEAFLGVPEDADPPPEHAPRGSVAPGPAGRKSKALARGAGSPSAVGIAELAARHEALIRALVDKGLLGRDEYERRLAEVRAKRIPHGPPSAHGSVPGRAAPSKPRPRRP